MFKDSQVIIAVIALPDVSAERYGDRGRRMYCLQDTAAAVQNMLLVIHSLGLGAVWVGTFDDDAVSKALGLQRGRTTGGPDFYGFPGWRCPNHSASHAGGCGFAHGVSGASLISVEL